VDEENNGDKENLKETEAHLKPETVKGECMNAIEKTDVEKLLKNVKSISTKMGFSNLDSIKIITVISELSRNLYGHPSGGQIIFELARDKKKYGIKIIFKVKGGSNESISNLFCGDFKSKNEIGIGLIGVKKLIDDFRIESNDMEMQIIMIKWIHSKKTLSTKLSSEISKEFAKISESFIIVIEKHPKEETLVDIENIRKKNMIVWNLINELEKELKNKNELLKETRKELNISNEEVMNVMTELENSNKKLQNTMEGLERSNMKQKLYLDQLNHMNIRLKELDQLKSMFLASMSHELRTPLNSIIGFTSWLLMGMEGDLNEEQKEQLSMVKSSANLLLDLINDILDISKIEAGKVDLDIEKFEIAEVVNDVVNSVLPLVKDKGLNLIYNVPEGIIINNDKRRIKQILMNLVSNAIKFTDQGNVKIEGKLLTNKDLEVIVSDSGIGIKKEDMEKLFKPFQQIDMSSTRRHAGTGLGLHLSKKLLNLLQGDISVKSQFGKGSEFKFIIPIEFKEEV